MKGEADEGTGFRLTGSLLGAATCWWDDGGLDVEGCEGEVSSLGRPRSIILHHSSTFELWLHYGDFRKRCQTTEAEIGAKSCAMAPPASLRYEERRLLVIGGTAGDCRSLPLCNLRSN